MYDVIPEGSLATLSPEDLRLILCGCHSIDTERLRLVTIFEDESSECPPCTLSHSHAHTLIHTHREGRGVSDKVQGLVLVCGGANEHEREAGAALFLDQQPSSASQH